VLIYNICWVTSHYITRAKWIMWIVFCDQSSAMEAGQMWLGCRLGNKFSQHGICAQGEVWLDVGGSFIWRPCCTAGHRIDAHFWNARYSGSITYKTTTTTIALQLFVRHYPVEPVAEEIFTHSHIFWSSTVLYLLPPSNMIRSVLLVQFMYLTVFLHHLCPGPPWSTS